MVKRLFAVAFIFCCTSAAWMILGGTITARTGSANGRLRDHVQSIWGAPHNQMSPSAEYKLPVRYTETVTENGTKKTLEKTRMNVYSIRPSSSDIAVDLQSEHRRKGLLWYSTYRGAFRGDYVFRIPEPVTQKLQLILPLPAAQAIYDDLQFLVNGQPFAPVTEKERARVNFELASGETVRFQVAYRSQGLESWMYIFDKHVNPVENFHLRM